MKKPTKQDLAKELVKIRNKHIKLKESQIPKLTKLKSQLAKLKSDNKETVVHKLNQSAIILFLILELEDDGVNGEKLEKLVNHSIKELAKLDRKDLEKKSNYNIMLKLNKYLTDKLLVLIDDTIVQFKKEIKEWKSKKVKNA